MIVETRMQKYILFIILLLTHQTINANDLNYFLNKYDKSIARAKYQKATKALLSAQKISPYNEEVIYRMKMFKTIIESKNKTSGQIKIDIPQYAREYENKMQFNQKFYNPSRSDIVTGFLAVAGVVVGVKYLQNWSDKQDQISISKFYDSPSLHVTIKNGGWFSHTVESFTITLRGSDSSNKYINKKESHTKSFFSSAYTHFDNLPKGSYTMIINGNDSYSKKIFSFTTTLYFEAKTRECKVINLGTKRIESSTCAKK